MAATGGGKYSETGREWDSVGLDVVRTGAGRQSEDLTNAQ